MPTTSLLSAAVASVSGATLKGALALGTTVVAFFEGEGGTMVVVTAVQDAHGATSLKAAHTVRSTAREMWTTVVALGGVRVGPHFAHDCECCRYVGSGESAGWGRFDGYVCGVGGEACIVARLSDEPADNLSRSLGLGRPTAEDPGYPIGVVYSLAVQAGAV